jgi:hypothetical protein
MNIEIPHAEALQELLQEKKFKRKLILWSYFVQINSVSIICKSTGFADQTVRDVIKKWEDFGVVEDLPRSGRPKEISPKEEKMIMEIQDKDRLKPATDINKEMKELGHDLSYFQILDVINNNYISVYAPYKIELKPKHMQERIEFCQSMLDWRDWKWETIVWTDEKLFRIQPLGKKIRVKVHFNESIDYFSQPLRQQGGAGIMFWGAISSRAKFSLRR